MNRWKVIIRYTAIFVLGLALGMAGCRLAHKHRLAQVMRNRPVVQRQMMMRHLQSQLQLTKPQQIEIERIVDAQIKALADLRARHQPEVQAIFQQAQDEMKPHLQPRQQEQLDQIMQRMQKYRPGHGRRPPPPL